MSARALASELYFGNANLFYHIRSKESFSTRFFVETLEYAVRHVGKSSPATMRCRRGCGPWSISTLS